MRRAAWAALGLAVLAGCGGRQVDIQTLASASDAIIWEAAQKAAAKKDWDAARQYYKRLVDAFPQSQHFPDARIGLADSYFEQGGPGNYVLAVSAYREFLTLYPQHSRSDYAQFQVGEAYFKQRNSSDRDQTSTKQALEEYERLLDVYPESKWVETARERIHDCRQALAKASYQVGYFYQKTRKAWRAAIGRYETVVNDYPDYERLDEVLFRLAQVLSFSGRYAEARPRLGRLRTEFPESPFVKEADALEASFPPTAPQAPSPTPTPPATPQPQV